MDLFSRAALFLPFLIASCHSPGSAGSPAPTGASGGGAEKFGVLAPLHPQTISLWPEAHGGAFVVLEVLSHGSVVKRGDVIARCETRAIDEELHRSELELAS